MCDGGLQREILAGRQFILSCCQSVIKKFGSLFPDFDNDSPNSLTRVRDPFN